MSIDLRMKCIGCGEVKSPSLFHNDAHRTLGKKTRCAACVAKQRKPRRKIKCDISDIPG